MHMQASKATLCPFGGQGVEIKSHSMPFYWS